MILTLVFLEWTSMLSLIEQECVLDLEKENPVELDYSKKLQKKMLLNGSNKKWKEQLYEKFVSILILLIYKINDNILC
jgi:hypothetical protein